MHFNSILFSDYDFTLDEHGSPDVFAKNLEAIKKWRSAGNFFVVATGRGEESLRSVFPDFDQYCDFCVLCDGGLIKYRDGKIVYIDRFGENLAKRLTDAIVNADFTEDYALICFNEAEESPNIEAGTCKIRFWFSDLSDCIKMQNILDAKFTEEIEYIAYHNVIFNDDARLPWVSHSMSFIIEVNRTDTDKSTGIQRILDALGVHNRERIAVIGDGKNDLCMIQDFNGYVVEGGDPEVVKHIQESHRVPHLHNLITSKLLQH